MERTEIQQLAARAQHIVNHEDWQVWREFCEIEFRGLVMKAMLGTDPDARLTALDRAYAMLQVTKGFELEAEKLAKMLTFEKLDGDRAVSKKYKEQLARVGGPQPYKEEING